MCPSVAQINAARPDTARMFPLTLADTWISSSTGLIAVRLQMGQICGIISATLGTSISRTLQCRRRQCRSAARLKQAQPFELFAHHSVALTGGFLMPTAVLDG